MSPEEYLKEPYARILIPEGEGYSAELLEFPGCFAQGETPDEAFRNLDQAALAWIQTSLEQGHEIPPPSMNAGYAGKVALRLPRSIHKMASRLAQRDGVSLNQFLLSSISARVGAEDLYSRITDKLDDRIMACVSGTKLLSASTSRLNIFLVYNNPIQATAPANNFQFPNTIDAIIAHASNQGLLTESVEEIKNGGSD